MSKYIDASLVVEVHVYDDEHEEWGMWSVTIEELLNRWTEGGCPPTIEVGEDCIGRADLIESFLADNECKREEAKACMCSLDLMLELIEDAPSVTPKERTGEWIEHKYAEEYDGLMQSNFECSKCHDWLREQTNYCPTCGARMKGENNENLN